MNDLHYYNMQHTLKSVATDIRTLLNKLSDQDDAFDKELNAAIISEDLTQEAVIRAKIALNDQFIEQLSDIYEDRFAGKN